MGKDKLLIALAVLALISGTIVASMPNAAADTGSTILAIVKTIQTTVQSTQGAVWSILRIVQSTQTTVRNTNNNLNKVKVETVISGSVLVESTPGGEIFPDFAISANETWDLMAVYVSTSGILTNGELAYGTYVFGSRTYSEPELVVANGVDINDFPIFPSDMTGGTQSVIAVPPNVQVEFMPNLVANSASSFTVSFKIVIQRPIDPSFGYSVTWGI